MPMREYNNYNTPILRSRYRAMACHCFALSADPHKIESVHHRYTEIGNLLTGHRQPRPANTSDQRWSDAINELATDPQSVIELLADDFGFHRLDANQNLRTPECHIWGVFYDGQLLPEHMWFTCGNGIFDTMPGQHIRRDTNINGLNAPSEAHAVPAANGFSTRVRSLTAHQARFAHAPLTEWR